jgi:hypothetical protein
MKARGHLKPSPTEAKKVRSIDVRPSHSDGRLFATTTLASRSMIVDLA